MKKQKENKSQRKKQTLLASFIALIMISSVIGFMWGSEGSSVEKYNGYKFKRGDSSWVVKYKGVDLKVNYIPSQLEDINVSEEIKRKLISGIEIDFTSSLHDKNNESIAKIRYEIEKTLSNEKIPLKKYIVQAYAENSTYGHLIMDCENAQQHIPLIYFKTGNETKIYEEERCIIAQAKNQMEFERVKHIILYSILGIM